jgi:hypothetical protein
MPLLVGFDPLDRQIVDKRHNQTTVPWADLRHPDAT